MSTTVQATYQDGMLKLKSPLPLPENVEVQVTVNLPVQDDVREEFLELSRKGLEKTWDNSSDDVFNELR